jgi:sugar phosphate isomerase/epimerase
VKTGVVTDSLAHLGFDELLDTCVELGIAGIELNTGNWSSAPHCDLDGLLGDEIARKDLLGAIESRGLELFALNANGNQLHPTDGDRQSKVLHDTIRLAGQLGVDTVVCMSGLPSGAPGDTTPNWVVSSWPPETQSILRYQWEDVALPYWTDLVALAGREGVERIAVELHGNQLVSNAPTLLRLRDEVGRTVGANLDPSHMMWMGGDPLQAVDLLGEATYHVHAKDTYVNPARVGTRTLLENGPLGELPGRSWWYVTLGYGHDEQWWRDFCYRLRLAGYDGWLSIEHEDMNLSRVEGLRMSVDLLRNVAPTEVADFEVQDV